MISLGEQEDLKPTAMDNCIEVFVSAVATPGDLALILVSRGQRNKLIFREVLGAKDWSSFCWPGQTYPGLNIDSIVGFWMLTFLGDDRLLHTRGKCQFSQPQVFCFFFVLVPFLKQPFVPSSVDEGEIVAARYSDESSFYRWRILDIICRTWWVLNWPIIEMNCC